MKVVKISHISATFVDVDAHLQHPSRSTWDPTRESDPILAVSVAKLLHRQVRGIRTRKFTLTSLRMCAASVELVSSGRACWGAISFLNILMIGRSRAPTVENSSSCQPCWDATCVRYTVTNTPTCAQTVQLSSSYRAAWKSTGVLCTISRSHTGAVSVIGCSVRRQICVHTCGCIPVKDHFSVQSVDWHSRTPAPWNHTCAAMPTNCRWRRQLLLCLSSDRLMTVVLFRFCLFLCWQIIGCCCRFSVEMVCPVL